MIGLISGEDWLAIELSPKYAKKCPKWLRVVLPLTLPPKFWGEWGVSFSGLRCLVVHKGHEQNFHRKRR